MGEDYLQGRESGLLRISLLRTRVNKSRREARALKEPSGANLRAPDFGVSCPIPFSSAMEFLATADKSLARASAAIVSFEPCS
jgi:hypothetical protein